jgi:Heterokaryon incompatibility protein (HET)
MAQSDINGSRSRGPRHEEYNYDPLPDNQRSIRLLNLLGSASYDAEIECEVFTIDFRRDEQLSEPYEAVSWRWGSLPASKRITIRWHHTQKRVRKSKLVSPDLLAALKAFRYRERDRSLWIDQICIDQENDLEKSHQVGLMSEIYGRAATVRVWLGPADEASRVAIRFVKNQLSPLQTFDELCRDESAYENWRALYSLLQRPWFSRRWVVQEIALARSAIVHCGDDKVSWKDLAIAVELFVEAESRLSRTLEREPRFHRVLGDLKNVSALGASLLVDATNKVFRGYWDLDWEGEAGNDHDAHAEEGNEDRDSAASSVQGSVDDLDSSQAALSTRSLREPLLTLEYLVSSLSLFGVTTPHDAIYSLLAIAKDTYPFIEVTSNYANRNKMLLRTVLEKFTQQQMYRVDYEHEFADVCKSFVQFCINASGDPLRALDIICRPWAPFQASKSVGGAVNGENQRMRGNNTRSRAGQLLRRDMARRQSEWSNTVRKKSRCSK